MEVNKIYCEDCLLTMGRMPDDFVDLTVTSPPYNLGNNHHTGSKRHTPYSDEMSEKEYQEWQLIILKDLFRITKFNGWIFYQHKNRIKNNILITPYSWLLKSNFVIRQEIVWHNGSPNMDNKRFYPFTERIYCLAKSDKSYMTNTLKLTDDWHIRPVGTNNLHKRSFPEKLVGNIIQSIPYAELIYDPFSGSGTVPKMAIKLNRNWIASEISQEYCDIAEKRIKREQSILKLF